jgi:Tat protein translocase TatB subunit
MFGMGWQEILLILVIGVLVIGPDQIPQVARTIGKLVAQFKRATNDLRSAVSQEIAQHEELKDFRDFTSDMESEFHTIGSTAQQFVQKEMEKGEAELNALEKEIEAGAAQAGDGGSAPAPEHVPPYQPGPGDFPSEEEQQAIAGEKPKEKAATPPSSERKESA